MINLYRKPCLIIVILLFNPSVNANAAEPNISNESWGSHSVGFQLIENNDPSRQISGIDSNGNTSVRPVRTWLWYPASSDEESETMRFGRYAELANGDIWPKEISGNLSEELKFSRRVLARSLEEEKFRNLLQSPMASVENATALQGPFPLIVIGQGLYYESPVVFASLSEYLASFGFTVATTPLLGTNSPIVRMNIVDLETQVRDLEFAISTARQLNFVSPDLLGVFGFDMGGMAGLILSMRNPDVDAFASVSSGILYPRDDGLPVDSPHYYPSALNVPWLHSVPAYWLKPPDSDDSSLFHKARSSDRMMLLTEKMGHVDYTGYALIGGRKAMGGYWQASTEEGASSHIMVRQYIYRFFAAYLLNDSESHEFLGRDPGVIFPDSGMRITRLPAEPEPPVFEEIVREIVAGNGAQAVARLRSVQSLYPDHPLVQEYYLERLVWSLRDTWGYSDQLMPVIQFRTDLFPESIGALHMLAEAQISQGHQTLAVQTYRKILEKKPDDQYAQSQLDALEQ